MEATMNTFFHYRGRRIRPLHLSIYRTYLLLTWFPFLLFAGYYSYLFIYPLIQMMQQRQIIDWVALLVPIGGLFLILFLSLFLLFMIRRFSFLKGGFFYRVYQRQMLARLLKSNGLYEKKERKSKEQATEKMVFPKVYYRNTKEILYLTVPTDGMKWHDRFQKIAKTFEEMYIADFIEEQKEMGFTTYLLMIDVISKRIGIEDCFVTNGQVKLMDGVVWDYAEVPHMLVTGGTGGGKSYFLLTLIHALIQVGTVDVCDPKEADLKDLESLHLFKNHVFYGTKWVTKCLKNAVEEMNRRYVYMKALPNYTTGKNFSYYGIPPYFIIVDEWAAFFGTLAYKEQDEILRYVKELVLKARQAGVFLILATQRPDADNFGGGVRDNLLFRVSLGKLSEQGYYMTFGSDQKGKAFINKRIKGRGYCDNGSGVPREFYAPLVPKKYDFLVELQAIGSMKTLNTKELLQEMTSEEINEAHSDFGLSQKKLE